MDKEKIVCIDDMGNKMKFKIVLFDAISGLDFMDKFIKVASSKEDISIKPFLSDLLPLSYSLDDNNNIVQQLSLETAGVLFQSPVSIIELGLEILDLQQVFIKNSAKFQMLMKPLQNLFPVKTSE